MLCCELLMSHYAASSSWDQVCRMWQALAYPVISILAESKTPRRDQRFNGVILILARSTRLTKCRRSHAGMARNILCMLFICGAGCATVMSLMVDIMD